MQLPQIQLPSEHKGISKAQWDELQTLTNLSNTTKRAVSFGAEKHLHIPYLLHNYGFVRFIDYMGNDAAVVQAARVSYGVGTKSVNDDQNLINYLLRHYHTTPFEMLESKWHFKMPIFVGRQWVRHRTANMNEYSGRYSVIPSDHIFIPSPDDLTPQSSINNQGRSEEHSMSLFKRQAIVDKMLENAKMESVFYKYMIGEISEQELDNLSCESAEFSELIESLDDIGLKEGETVSRELARINLPLSIFTEFYWKIDAHNLMHFMRLRCDSHAQKEIRDYATIMSQIFKDWCPMTWNAFEEYRLKAVSLGGNAVELITLLLSDSKLGINEIADKLGIGKRELSDIKSAFKLEM